MESSATPWESPHHRRLLGPPTISDDAVSALREQLRDQPAIPKAYLVEQEIIEPSRGTSYATNLALWLCDPGVDAEAGAEKQLEIVQALAETLELQGLELSFVTPAGLAAARRRGLRVF